MAIFIVLLISGFVFWQTRHWIKAAEEEARKREAIHTNNLANRYRVAKGSKGFHVQEYYFDPTVTSSENPNGKWIWRTVSTFKKMQDAVVDYVERSAKYRYESLKNSDNLINTFKNGDPELGEELKIVDTADSKEAIDHLVDRLISEDMEKAREMAKPKRKRKKKDDTES